MGVGLSLPVPSFPLRREILAQGGSLLVSVCLVWVVLATCLPGGGGGTPLLLRCTVRLGLGSRQRRCPTACVTLPRRRDWVPPFGCLVSQPPRLLTVPKPHEGAGGWGGGGWAMKKYVWASSMTALVPSASSG